LSWDRDVFGNFAFHFDSELEEGYASTRTYRCPAPAPAPSKYSSIFSSTGGVVGGKESCPLGLMGIVRDAWMEFLERGNYYFRTVIPLPEDEDDEDGEEGGIMHDSIGESEWDDADVPVPVSVPPNHHCNRKSCNKNKKPSEDPEDFDFDFIDDVIEEEFPRIKKTLLLRQQQRQHENKHKPLHNSNNKPSITHDWTNSAGGVQPQTRPAPVVIPPKNMAIGRVQDSGGNFGRRHHDHGKEEKNYASRAALGRAVSLRLASH
jgi:hypothetical protein